MVDFHTYKQLHGNSLAFKTQYDDEDIIGVKRMSESVMEAEEPPPAPGLYVLPETIIGYNLRTKKWSMQFSFFDNAPLRPL